MLDLVYRDARHRVTTLATALDDGQLLRPVPATPEWTVHDLLAHLVGGAADAAHDRLDGAGSEHWTRRHVAERTGDSVEALLVEWDRVGPEAEVSLTGRYFTGPNLAADLICHEADLGEALRLPRVDRTHWDDPFLPVMMSLLGQRLRNTASVTIHDEYGNEWRCGSGSFVTDVQADGYELLRAMFSRRSRRQIADWAWTLPPTSHVIDSFGFFGPRDDDQPIPGPPRSA